MLSSQMQNKHRTYNSLPLEQEQEQDANVPTNSKEGLRRAEGCGWREGRDAAALLCAAASRTLEWGVLVSKAHPIT